MDLRDIADAALELSIVGSFSSVGYEARRRLYRWADLGPDTLTGRVVAITGPTSGLGHAAADAMAAAGARLLLLGRNAEKLDAVVAELPAAAGPEPHSPVLVDMASLASVAAAVGRLRASESRLDVIVDNAGAMFAERTASP